MPPRLRPPLTSSTSRGGPAAASTASFHRFYPVPVQRAYGIDSLLASGNQGQGQTIGIFEVGYNPAFVDTPDPNYSTSALAVFDTTFHLPTPPSLTFVDHSGTPLSSTNNSTNNPDFLDYGAGIEIALDIESVHAMAPRPASMSSCAAPNSSNYYEDIPLGIATLRRPPGRLGGLGQLWLVLGCLWPGVARANVGQHILQPAIAATPNVTLRVVGRQRGGSRADLPVRITRGRVGGRHQPESLNGAVANVSSEVGWSGSGGGYSQAFANPPPTNRTTASAGNTNGMRTDPDVAADADPNTGVAVYDPYDLGPAPPGFRSAAPAWRRRCGPAWSPSPTRATSWPAVQPPAPPRP